MNRYGSLAYLVGASVALGLALVTNGATAQTPASAPVIFEASYQASANGLKAVATRSLTQLDNGAYELTNQLQATVLGQEIARLDQRTRFHLADASIVTERYAYRVSGITSDMRSIDFDWKAGTALSIEEDESWLLALQEAQVFDPLSHQVAMSQQLRVDQAGGFKTDYEYRVIDGDAIESHRYQLLGEEILETPLGKLKTVKLERVRAGNSSRSTVIWLALDWDFLVARIEQTNGSLRMQLELETAEVAGATVLPIPAL